MARTHSLFGIESPQPEARPPWLGYVVLGIVLLVLGAIAFANLLPATVASVYLVGILMVIGGIAQIAHAFVEAGWGRRVLWALSGVIYGLAGALAIANPLLAAAVLSLLLAVSMIVAGGLRIGWSASLRKVRGWAWLLASGAITTLAGIVFLLGWPANAWLLGVLLAVDLTFQGVAALAFGLALRRMRMARR